MKKKIAVSFFIILAVGLLGIGLWSLNRRIPESEIPIGEHIERNEQSMIATRLRIFIKSNEYLAATKSEKEGLIDEKLNELRNDSMTYMMYPLVKSFNKLNFGEYEIITTDGSLLSLVFEDDMLEFDTIVDSDTSPKNMTFSHFRDVVGRESFAMKTSEERMEIIEGETLGDVLPIKKDTIKRLDNDLFFVTNDDFCFRIRCADNETFVFLPQYVGG